MVLNFWCCTHTWSLTQNALLWYYIKIPYKIESKSLGGNSMKFQANRIKKWKLNRKVVVGFIFSSLSVRNDPDYYDRLFFIGQMTNCSNNKFTFLKIKTQNFVLYKTGRRPPSFMWFFNFFLWYNRYTRGIFLKYFVS